MNRQPTVLPAHTVPDVFHTVLKDAVIYDSSCSRAARVYFIDKDCGYYLKTAAKGTLETEAKLTRFFHIKQLAAEVIAYESLERDWLLTTRIPGEDCIFPMYLEDPIRLCNTTGELLRMLHTADGTGCPVPNRTADYLATAVQNYRKNTYNIHLFPDNWGYSTPEEAWHMVETYGSCLKTDTLLHGDYCLPNIMLNNWRFTGFLDFDAGGIGDRHIDLFWGIWTLQYNLKTDRYRNRFLDAYGRNDIDEDLFRVIAAIEVFL